MKRIDNRTLSWIIAFVAFFVAWGVADLVLPKHLPPGPVLYGVILGGLNALIAMGIVLIYRSARIINFSQVEIGGVASSIAVVLVLGNHFNYVLAIFIGLIAAGLIGFLIDRIVVWRFQNSPRLILTVATIGVSSILGGLEFELPNLYKQGTFSNANAFKAHLNLHFTLSSFSFTADDIIALIVVPIVIAILWWFLTKTDVGAAIRACSDSIERATLLGIPVRRLSMITWVVAAILAGIGSILTQPIVGLTPGQPLGYEVLLAPLAAALIARFDNLPVALFASVVLGVIQQAIFWSYPKSSFVDLVTFLVIAFALLAQRSITTRRDDQGLGEFTAIQEIRPLPRAVLRLPAIRLLTWATIAVTFAVLIVVPAFNFSITSSSYLLFYSTIAIYAIIAISLVVLTGWAGQISLGQFAFTGAGASAAGFFLVSVHLNVAIAILLAMVVGAIIAILVGIPALRIPGLNLAVITLAFAVTVNTFFINQNNFPQLAPSPIPQPLLFGRIDLANQRQFYYVCLAALMIVAYLARNFQKTRAGRVVRAIRDNARAGAAFSISPFRARMLAFGFAGTIAGLAGALYALSLGGVPGQGFDPAASVQVFTMVVFGGIGSLLGGVLGAIYVESIFFFIKNSSAWQYLGTGAGLLLILYIFPQGVGGLVYIIRDKIVSLVLKHSKTNLTVEGDEIKTSAIPGLAHEAAVRLGALEELELASKGQAPAQSAGSKINPESSELAFVDVDSFYGKTQALYSVSAEVKAGEILALLGTNGAGKSTLLKVAAGLINCKKGTVYYKGQPINAYSPTERVRSGLVMVPGGRGVFSTLTVRENLRLAAWTTKSDSEYVSETLAKIFALFPVLQQRLNTRAELLSGGEQQMLTIAQSMLCKPQVLLIDELSLGLAPTVVSQLLNAVRNLSEQGVTIVLVEQSVNVATAIASRAIFMERGQVRFSGPTPSVEQQPNLLRAVFLRAATRAHGKTKQEFLAARSVDNLGTKAFGVNQVSISFGGVRVLNEMSFSVAKGEILGIIGANGAGKTTLFDVCSGFLKPDSGRVIMDNQDITGMSPSRRAARGLGRLFQDAQLFPTLTVADVIAVALERQIEVKDPVAGILGLQAAFDSESAVKDRVDELIEELGLEKWRSAFVTELSAGTRRIVDLACAMAHKPKVLLLDEPSSGIAQRESEAMAEMLLGLSIETGASFVVIEHDVPLVSYIADRLICMHLGEVLAEGNVNDVLNDPLVIAAYLGKEEATINRSTLVGA